MKNLLSGFNLRGLLGSDDRLQPLPAHSPIFVGLTTNEPLDVRMREFMYALRTEDRYDILLGAAHIEHSDDIETIESLQRGQKFLARSGGPVNGVELMFGLRKDEVSPLVDLPDYVPGASAREKAHAIS